MGTIPGFWAGARRYARGVDLLALAEQVGGWPALEADPGAALRDFGAPDALIEAWLAVPAERTVGIAVCLSDPRYPAALAQTPSPPPVLCCEGEVALLERPSWAIVGTRRCTGVGLHLAGRLASGLAASGIPVVSGLARGIDAAAHQGALRTGATVAVLAHGLPFTAPQRHLTLRAEIEARGGLVVSPFADAQPPRPHTFPQRNPVIAGLATGVVVVEADLHSGALLTAASALEVGRPVWAVPGSPDNPAARGANRLIADGATVLEDVDDFLARIGAKAAAPTHPWLAALRGGATLDEVHRRHAAPLPALIAAVAGWESRGALIKAPGQRYLPGRSVE